MLFIYVELRTHVFIRVLLITRICSVLVVTYHRVRFCLILLLLLLFQKYGIPNRGHDEIDLVLFENLIEAIYADSVANEAVAAK